MIEPTKEVFSLVLQPRYAWSKHPDFLKLRFVKERFFIIIETVAEPTREAVDRLHQEWLRPIQDFQLMIQTRLCSKAKKRIAIKNFNKLRIQSRSPFPASERTTLLKASSRAATAAAASSSGFFRASSSSRSALSAASFGRVCCLWVDSVSYTDRPETPCSNSSATISLWPHFDL